MNSGPTILVVDLECACWKGRPPRGMTNEIIEIGITSVNSGKLEIIKSSTILVNPYKASISPFCTELTSLSKERLEADGVKFKRAIQILHEEFTPKRKLLCTWGDDHLHFQKMCTHWNLKYPFSTRHLNLKTIVSSLLGSKKELGVNSALLELGLEFEGMHHSGKDDAYNTARILIEVWKRCRTNSNIDLKVDKKIN